MTEGAAVDPLGMLAQGLVDPLMMADFNPAFRSETGALLMEWLREGGASVPMLLDCCSTFQSYAADNLETLGWDALRSELATLALMRGYDNVARFYGFLQLALVQVKDAGSFEALLALLRWLVQALTMREVSGPLSIGQI
jgi:hypothetical protein